MRKNVITWELVMSHNNSGSTVAVSKEIHEKIHKLCELEDRKVKAVVNEALKEYLKSRLDCSPDIEFQTTEVLRGGFIQ